MNSVVSGFFAQRLKMGWRIALCSIAAALIGCFVADQTVVAADEVLVFKQRNVVTGHYTVSISPHGIKLVNEAQNSRLIASAPDWKLYMFNDTSKKYFAVNPKEFKGVISSFVLSARGFNFSKVSFEKEKSYAIAGVPVDKYKMQIHSQRVTSAALSRGEGENLNLTSGETITLSKQIIPVELVHALCRFYCLPEQDKFVLDLRAMRYKKMSLMLTFSGPTKTPYEPSMFKHSVDGFTKGKSEYDVSVNVTEAIY